MKRSIYILIIAFIITVSSCTQMAIYDPYYTSIRKLHDVDMDMNIDKVNEVLGINPYEIYYNANEKQFVVLYKYKHVKNKVNAAKVTTEEALTDGRPYYHSPGTIYMTFNGDYKLVGYFTDQGRKGSKDELVFENTLAELIKDPTKYTKIIGRKQLPVKIVTSEVIVPNNNVAVETPNVEKKKKDYVERNVLIAFQSGRNGFFGTSGGYYGNIAVYGSILFGRSNSFTVGGGKRLINRKIFKLYATGGIGIGFNNPRNGNSMGVPFELGVVMDVSRFSFQFGGSTWGGSFGVGFKL